MQFSRYIWFYINRIKWRIRDSNSWPPACKAGALPTELIPHIQFTDMGLSGLEPPTSRLSGVRSNRLSYKPIFFFCFGGHLLSHTVSSAVPSASQVLTIVFGMGTGVSPGRIATEKLVLTMKFFLLDSKLPRQVPKNRTRTKLKNTSLSALCENTHN